MLVMCVDCDHEIIGAYVLASTGDSMSGARPDAYAHPPRSPACRPLTPRKRELRRRLDRSARTASSSSVTPDPPNGSKTTELLGRVPEGSVGSAAP